MQCITIQTITNVNNKFMNQNDSHQVSDSDNIGGMQRAGQCGNRKHFLRFLEIEKWRVLFRLSTEKIPPEEASPIVADDDLNFAGDGGSAEGGGFEGFLLLVDNFENFKLRLERKRIGIPHATFSVIAGSDAVESRRRREKGDSGNAFSVRLDRVEIPEYILILFGVGLNAENQQIVFGSVTENVVLFRQVATMAEEPVGRGREAVSHSLRRERKTKIYA